MLPLLPTEFDNLESVTAPTLGCWGTDLHNYRFAQHHHRRDSIAGIGENDVRSHHILLL